MEPKHKELLDQYHQNLLESITDANRVIELLGKAGTLSQLERYELDNNCSSSSEKTDLLLKMLMNKERDHFPDLCVALEKTHPHLYSALFVNGVGPVDNSSDFEHYQKPYIRDSQVGLRFHYFKPLDMSSISAFYAYVTNSLFTEKDTIRF
ncbi:UNVERIFIED_CONTAM: hypothetical protein FKN15_059080 [Acipenser sinensis]